MTAHFVYRCFDDAGALLYIGCTGNVERRLAAHRRGGRAVASRWLAVCMASHTTSRPFPTKAVALSAEASAIRIEQPLFNCNERRIPGWLTRPHVARYLLERGHIALAMETTCSCAPEIAELGGYDESCLAHVAGAVARISDLPLIDFEKAIA